MNLIKLSFKDISGKLEFSFFLAKKNLKQFSLTFEVTKS